MSAIPMEFVLFGLTLAAVALRGGSAQLDSSSGFLSGFSAGYAAALSGDRLK